MTKYLGKEPFIVGGTSENYRKNYDKINWKDNKMKCPKCGVEAQQEMADVGPGEIPCGLPYCPDCQWVAEDITEDIIKDKENG